MQRSARSTQANMLSKRQKAFVDLYVTHRQGAKSARLAGYSVKTARQMAAENLTKPVILAAISAKEVELSEKFDLDLNAVIGGIFGAISQAREKNDPSGIIKGWAAVSRLLGYDKPEASKSIELSTSNQALEAKISKMSDEELLAIVEGLVTPP